MNNCEREIRFRLLLVFKRVQLEDNASQEIFGMVFSRWLVLVQRFKKDILPNQQNKLIDLNTSWRIWPIYNNTTQRASTLLLWNWKCFYFLQPSIAGRSRISCELCNYDKNANQRCTTVCLPGYLWAWRCPCQVDLSLLHRRRSLARRRYLFIEREKITLT